MLRRVQNNSPLHSLEVEFATSPISSAREFGLTDEWTKKLVPAQPVGASRCSRRCAWSAARRPRQWLQQGDLVLAIDGQVVTRFREVERAVADKKQREGHRVAPAEPSRRSTSTPWSCRAPISIGSCSGPAPRCRRRIGPMAAQRGIPPLGVYVGYFAYGSPATRYGLYPGRRIVEVDGVPTPNLDAFLAAVTGRPDRSSVRLRTITWNNAPEVITLKLDKHYWPAYELVRWGERMGASRRWSKSGCSGVAGDETSTRGVASAAKLLCRIHRNGLRRRILALLECRPHMVRIVRATQVEIETAVQALRDGELVAFPH